MKKLINDLHNLKDKIKPEVDKRIAELKNNTNVFSELCFCLLTANYSAEGGMRIQKQLFDEFDKLSEKKLAIKLKELGHRFPNARAKYIVEARDKQLQMNRDWLVNNVKGLGMKEASHFLRNIGQMDYAIVDFHIIDVLVRYGLIERPKILSKNKYLEIETKLKELAVQLGMLLGELDFYLWYMETGKVLK